MTKVFVIADTHFGHANVINVPGRVGLFDSIHHHDETLIENWNGAVTKRDVVYLLGDIGFDSKGYVSGGVLPRLNGRIEAVGGNHDSSELLAQCDKVHGVKVLTHIPIHPQEMYWDINVHGHLHGNTVKKHADNPAMGWASSEKDVRYVCVSCEHVGFTPVNLLELLEDYRARWSTVLDKYPLPPGRKRRDQRGSS
jgi:calcineurin-like phosphoesterase family protein